MTGPLSSFCYHCPPTVPFHSRLIFSSARMCSIECLTSHRMCLLPLHFDSGYYKFKGDYLADRPMYVLMHPSGEIYSQCLDGSKTCKPEDRIPRFK